MRQIPTTLPFHKDPLKNSFLSPSCGLVRTLIHWALGSLCKICVCVNVYNLIIVICSVLVEVDCVAGMKVKFSNL